MKENYTFYKTSIYIASVNCIWNSCTIYHLLYRIIWYIIFFSFYIFMWFIFHLQMVFHHQIVYCKYRHNVRRFSWTNYNFMYMYMQFRIKFKLFHCVNYSNIFYKTCYQTIYCKCCESRMIQLNKWTASNGFYNEKESFMYMQLKRKTGNFNNLYR